MVLIPAAPRARSTRTPGAVCATPSSCVVIPQLHLHIAGMNPIKIPSQGRIWERCLVEGGTSGWEEGADPHGAELQAQRSGDPHRLSHGHSERVADGQRCLEVLIQAGNPWPSVPVGCPHCGLTITMAWGSSQCWCAARRMEARKRCSEAIPMGSEGWRGCVGGAGCWIAAFLQLQPRVQ